MAAYGLASTITVTRVTAKQHFPSDVIVGSASGLVLRPPGLSRPSRSGVRRVPVGQPVAREYRRETSQSELHGFTVCPHRQLDLSLARTSDRFGLHAIQHARDASVDSYGSVLEWWRMPERSSKITQMIRRTRPGSTSRLIKSLPRKSRGSMAPRIVGAQVNSVYTRMTGISGTPVRDSYHFGQTLINDYGRPYWTGFNDITG